MKRLLPFLGIIIFTAVLSSCGESETSNSEETSNIETVKIGNLEVMTEDLGKMNWYDATKACADLGDGWRLPTKDELNILYKNKDKIGGFVDESYWSSTNLEDGASWGRDFGTDTGLYFVVVKGWDGFYVLAVRTF